MPFFELNKDEISFPPAHFADIHGLLAEGGDITGDWLLAGYKAGVFLWSSPIEALRWWSPDPRIVLFVNELKISADLQELKGKNAYIITYDQDLTGLLKLCEKIYNHGEMNPKWLPGVLANAYSALKEKGVLHSVEIWQDDNLLGGMFGTILGTVFFGEYVCGVQENIAELALISSVEKLKKEGVTLFDLHKETMETEDVGYREISRNEFISLL